MLVIGLQRSGFDSFPDSFVLERIMGREGVISLGDHLGRSVSLAVMWFFFILRRYRAGQGIERRHVLGGSGRAQGRCRMGRRGLGRQRRDLGNWRW